MIYYFKNITNYIMLKMILVAKNAKE